MDASPAGPDEYGDKPSELTEYEVWRRYQGENASDAKYLCYRPGFAAPPLPLTLVCEAFAKFKREAEEGQPNQRDIIFAQAFWEKLQSRSYVEDHDEEVKRILQTLTTNYLDENVNAYFPLQGRVHTDGMLVLKRLIRLVFEFKCNSGDPDFQVLDYFFRGALLQGVKKYRQYCLAICILGPRLEVFCATIEDGKVWAEPVAETKCYGPSEYLIKTARIWRAVRAFVSGYTPMTLVSPPVPWPLKMDGLLERLNDEKLLFKVKKPDGQWELAKLTRRYGLEAHRAWMPYAPTVMDGKLETAGDYYVVRMEYLSMEKGWLPADETVKAIQNVPQQLKKLKDAMTTALEAGHAKGYVHGDLRLCNILVSIGEVEKDGYPQYQVKICDFDWAGKAGQVSYPMIKPNIQWHPDVAYGAPICKEHDVHFLDHLLEQLQPPCKTFEEMLEELDHSATP